MWLNTSCILTDGAISHMMKVLSKKNILTLIQKHTEENVKYYKVMRSGVQLHNTITVAAYLVIIHANQTGVAVPSHLFSIRYNVTT